MRSFSLLMLLLLTACQLRAQSVIRDSVENEIIHLHLDRATGFIQAERDLAVRDYYLSHIEFLRYLSSDNSGFAASFEKTAKAATRSISDMEDDNPLRRVMLAEVHFLRGISRFLRKKYLPAVRDIEYSCRLIKENREEFPDNIEQLKLSGIFNIVIASIPRKYQWIGNSLCFKGDLQTGVAQLELASRKGQLLPQEANVILFYFQKNLLSQPKEALNRIRSLQEAQPGSFVYNYLLASSLLELRRTDEAMRLFQSKEPALEQDRDLEISPYWHYSRAKTHYFRQEYEAAIQYFDRFLDTYKGRTLQSDALFRKGISLVLLDRYPEARHIFKQLTEAESSGFDEDDYASFMGTLFLLREPSEVEKQLFRARNLFDGGNYEAALDILTRIRPNESSDLQSYELTERYYRMGRILQEMGQTKRAITAYKSSLDPEPGHNLWMKVYAHYYLGNLYAENGDKPQAESYFRKALEFRDYQYQSGLEQRCKAALYQLKKQ